MSRRSVWFAVLRGQEERDIARMAAPGRVHDDDDREGDTYFPAAHAHRGPLIEVTE